MWNATGSDLDSNDIAWHMYSGLRQEYDLKTPNKKFNNYFGWSELFSSTEPSSYRGDTSTNYASHPCFEVYTQRQMTESQGMLVGSRYIENAYEGIARWISPIGMQFKWHNLFTKASATPMQIYNLFLIYHDLWAPSRILYAPIVWEGNFSNSNSFVRGCDATSDSDWLNSGNGGGRSNGEFVGFVEENCMDIIRDKYTVSACLGFYLDMRITKYDGAVYDKVWDFWDGKPLFNIEPNQSHIVYPERHLLKDRMESGKVKLL